MHKVPGCMEGGRLTVIEQISRCQALEGAREKNKTWSNREVVPRGPGKSCFLSRADRKVLSDVVIFVQRFTCGKVVDEVWEVVNCRLRRALLAIVRSC